MAENIPTVQETFAELEERGIAVCFPDRLTRWCFRQLIWVILTLLVILILASVFSSEDPVLDFRALGKLQGAQYAYDSVRAHCVGLNEHDAPDYCSEISEIGLFAHTLRVLTKNGSPIPTKDLNGALEEPSDGSPIPTEDLKDAVLTELSDRGGWYWYRLAGRAIDATWYISAVLTVVISIALLRYFVLKPVIDDFGYLATAGRLLPDPDHAGSPWRNFAAKLEGYIHSRWRWVIITVGVGLVGVYIYWWVSHWSWTPSIDDPIGAILVFVKIMLTPAICVFIACVEAWMLWVFGTAIRELTPAFKLDILPEHSDDSGGLARIGEMASLLILPFTLGVIFLSIWISIGFLTPFLLPGVVVLALIGGGGFFWLLGDVHQVMSTEKVQYRDDLAEQIRETEDELLKILDRNGLELNYNESAAKRLQDLLDILRSRKDVARTYPVWPFSRKLVVAIFVAIFSHPVPPLVGLLLKLALVGSWAGFIDSVTK